MLSSESKTLLRSLHGCLRLTIYHYDTKNQEQFVLPCQNYCQEIYDYKGMVDYSNNLEEAYTCLFGELNEAFLSCRTEAGVTILGPFRYDTLAKKDLVKLLEKQNVDPIKVDQLYKILSTLPIYSIDKTTELLTLLLACLGQIQEEIDPHKLRLFGNAYRVKVDLSRLRILTSKDNEYELSLYAHEAAIKEYVKEGKGAVDIAQPFTQTYAGNSIRYEKDYSLIILELLTHTAITSGSTITDAYKLRQAYLAENESAQSLEEIMVVRAAAISAFKSIISDAKKTCSNPFITSVLQYIDLNIHTDLKVNAIADYFHISGTNLRKQFKQEVHVPIKRYILSCKMDLAKKMLSSGASSTEIAKALSFSDQSHFSRSFKSFEGITPMEYKRANIGKIIP
ncbi:YSIRK-targeted surface antigen transcriptional regulator [Atopobacter sp. AH10]|uniref:YSIRK-targeted surface antigen transcriptional regulator n=1 Tax=Atopobacter sp. AH10 TaxID=2315861 RepID=UPI000EF236B0|nr:YSIRK-targeted surface antigen transcriptional regulator [Atopobacter sp. AH10]RLK63679.1 YSIRK-targeted surface antigen transcriptional regulator [Atopobacter sp. AH10]